MDSHLRDGRHIPGFELGTPPNRRAECRSGAHVASAPRFNRIQQIHNQRLGAACESKAERGESARLSIQKKRRVGPRHDPPPTCLAPRKSKRASPTVPATVTYATNTGIAKPVYGQFEWHQAVFATSRSRPRPPRRRRLPCRNAPSADSRQRRGTCSAPICRIAPPPLRLRCRALARPSDRAS